MRSLSHRSIRFRLTALYMMILGISMMLAGTFLLYAFHTAAEATLDSDLHARFAALEETLNKRIADAYANRLGDAIEGHTAGSPAGVWIQVADDRGHWIHQAEALQNAMGKPPSAAGLPARGRLQTVMLQGAPMRVLTAPASHFVVQIAIPMRQFAEMQQRLRLAVALVLPLVVLAAWGGGYWLSGRALRPVDHIASTMRCIGTTNLGERLEVRGTGDELDRLAEVLNNMLARLDAAFRLVTQMTADASHELRTPIAIIRTTGEVTRATLSTTEDYEAAVDQIVMQAERASTIIDDLLFLARTDAGHLDIRMERLDLAEVLAEVVDEMDVLALDAGIRISQEKWRSRAIDGDREALRRLFVALVDNALKHSPAGGAVSIRMDAEEGGPRSSTTVSIHNAGSGIPEQDLDRIFDRFYRVSKHRSRRDGGSGLGLSIAQSLAAIHNGKITVESSPGAGAVFRVTLPAPLA